jgi:hypothetical protein
MCSLVWALCVRLETDVFGNLYPKQQQFAIVMIFMRLIGVNVDARTMNRQDFEPDGKHFRNTAQSITFFCQLFSINLLK